MLYHRVQFFSLEIHILRKINIEYIRGFFPMNISKGAIDTETHKKPDMGNNPIHTYK